MASRAGSGPANGSGGERIPFYRNVKVIGFLAQLIFVLLLIAAGLLMYRNVVSAIKESNIPADFGFLDDRAGIPIAETPIRYSPNDPYWRALLGGFLNTLKVALIGVVLATLLGILIGVMRLSSNWLVKQIASAYVETIRNTPLAVQIVFWFTAVLIPLPPRVLNPIELPGGILLSNKGLAFPFPYPSYRFAAWLPWLLAALAVLIVLYLVRRQQIIRSELPGNPWPLPILAAIAVAGVGYWVASATSTLPEEFAVDFTAARGRGIVYRDLDGNGEQGRNEPVVPFLPTTVTVAEGELTTTTQNLSESRRFVYSVFRFPPIHLNEVEQVDVGFADPTAAERFSLHFDRYPSAGLIYQDANGNGRFDNGEELDPAQETTAGFGGVEVVMSVQGFERHLVTDRDGQIRIPSFEPAGTETGAAAPATNPFSVLGPLSPRGSAAELEAQVFLHRAPPLVLSRPSIPVSNYEGGVSFTASYLALLLALVIYTASFIAEIVRGGILAVPKGQTEAAKALGLSGYQTFSLVVFPQAMRIVMPPMISQYLNLTKNSSLAPLSAYAELFVISTIVANQTGASVPMTVILIAAYLLISFTFAFILNIVNERMKLVER